MANPTTNFGWVMPTSSSLVTNLPADFNTFGQAVDTSMSELLGGTTGQVLSKTSNTNMDFTWVTPTDQTPLTTKGDLFTFTTVDARLGVGANGTVLTADSAESSGLKWATPSGSSFVGAACMLASTLIGVADSTFTTVVFASSQFDTNSIYNTGNGRFTVPSGKGGKWLFTAAATWSSNSTGYRQFAFVKNGSVTGSEENPAFTAGTNVVGMTASQVLNLSAADYIQLQVWQNSGGSLNISGTSSGNGRTFVSFTYLGA